MTTKTSTSFHSYQRCTHCDRLRAFILDSTGIKCGSCGTPINTDSSWAKLYAVNNTQMRG